MTWRLALLLTLLVSSDLSFGQPFKYSWNAKSIATLTGSTVRLMDKSKNVIGELPVQQVRDLLDIKERLTRAVGIDADLLIVDGNSPNAFATNVTGSNVIGFNLAMMQRFGSDKDALAAVMGHEVGHLVKNHAQEGQQREAIIDVIGLIAGLAIDYKLNRRYGDSGGLGRTTTSLGAGLVSRKFSRDQEREADKWGIEWMNTAGFDPSAAIRFWQQMGVGSDGLFFSTHPSHEERIQNIRTQIASLPPRPATTVASVQPATVAKPAPSGLAASLTADFKEAESAPDDPFVLSLQAYREKRFEEAFTLASTSAAQGDARGQFSVGYLYLSGQGVQKDYSKAEEYFRLSAEQGSASASTFLGLMSENGLGRPKDYVAAAKFYETAASSGFSHAQARLAVLKLSGIGIERDRQIAIDLATKSVSATEDSIGLYVLGKAAYDDKDYVQAKAWFERSGNKGFAPAQMTLGIMYANGWGVGRNYQEAARLYRLAVAKNNSSGKVGLGYLYIGGNGVPRDYAEAKRLFEEAHTQGNAVASMGLGRIYRDGLGAQQDFTRAYAYFDYSARKGNAAAAPMRDALRQKLSDAEITASEKLVAELTR